MIVISQPKQSCQQARHELITQIIHLLDQTGKLRAQLESKNAELNRCIRAHQRLSKKHH